MVLSPKDRKIAIKAYREDKLSVDWGMYGQLPRGFAEKYGWGNPLFGFKENFIRKMLESDENFELALIESGIDVYAPDMPL